MTLIYSDSPGKQIDFVDIADPANPQPPGHPDNRSGKKGSEPENVAVDENHSSRTDLFDEADLALLINDDNSVNLDPEGIAKASDGGFWVASEGSGTVGGIDRPA